MGFIVVIMCAGIFCVGVLVGMLLEAQMHWMLVRANRAIQKKQKRLQCEHKWRDDDIGVDLFGIWHKCIHCGQEKYIKHGKPYKRLVAAGKIVQ